MKKIVIIGSIKLYALLLWQLPQLLLSVMVLLFLVLFRRKRCFISQTNGIFIIYFSAKKPCKISLGVSIFLNIHGCQKYEAMNIVIREIDNSKERIRVGIFYLPIQLFYFLFFKKLFKIYKL